MAALALASPTAARPGARDGSFDMSFDGVESELMMPAGTSWSVVSVPVLSKSTCVSLPAEVAVKNAD